MYAIHVKLPLPKTIFIAVTSCKLFEGNSNKV